MKKRFNEFTCNFSTCRFMKNGNCTNEEKKKECFNVVAGVLGETYNEYLDWKQKQYADFGKYMNEPE